MDFETYGELQLAVVLDWPTEDAIGHCEAPATDMIKSSWNISYGLIMVWMEFWFNSDFWIYPHWW